jgi:uncharacterized protein (DUF3084 family)
MFWTVLALVLMVALGGFISYYGDLQGRRWGKRRVSWFGLRPKYTAVLITSLTGGFIALMSIVTVLLAFPTVKEVVLRGERLIEENKQLNISLAVQRKTQAQQLKELGDKVQLAHAEYLANLEAKGKLEKELAKSGRDLEDAQKKRVAMQTQLAALEQKQAALESTLQQERADIRRKANELKGLTADNKRVTEENNRAAEINDSLSQQIIEKNQKITKISSSLAELAQANAKMQMQQANLNRENSVLLDSNKRIIEENNDLEATSRERKQELDRKQAELDKVNADVDRAYAQLAGASKAFTQNYHTLRQGEITVRAGSELARLIVPAHLSSDAARKQVMGLLEDAGDTAQSVYKASRGDNDRAVRIVSKRLVTPTNTQDADEDASVNALAENIAASDTPVLVVAASLNNCVRGEQVLVELQPYNVRQVFKKEEAIASRLVNASLPLNGVKQIITDFLKEDVRNAAVRAGCIPRVDPTTGLKEVGVFDGIALNTLADHIKRLGGSVLLKAVASASMTSADPLDSKHLRFDTVAVRNGEERDPNSGSFSSRAFR